MDPILRLPWMAVLLFLSGACALVYQTAWLREFRLIFGGATPATAAVLAVFMGGLGLGGAWFGRRTERARNVLGLYARLEVGIGVAAALTPFALDLVRALYVRTGGVLTLGASGAMVAQLLLAVVVLFVPCVLLGGNLPPAVKWVSSEADPRRGSLGVVYGCNALGAVAGVLFGTFWALEHWGTRGTLYAAAGLNVALGLAAWMASRAETGDAAAPEFQAPPGPLECPRGGARSDAILAVAGALPPGCVYLVAGMTGFLFFLAELVWYRMLTPLLGGTVYGFGLILAEVLLGIGLGGWVYRFGFGGRKAEGRSEWLAILLMGQAVLLALPWALGDRLAVMSYHVHQARAFGFAGLVGGWSVTVASLVFLPAVFAGIQFPLLVSLLGEGRREAGRQVGTAYAANTAGAIMGSLLGGFWLIPLLGAPGCWRLIIGLTLVLGFVVLLMSERPWSAGAMAATLLGGLLAVGLGFRTVGPTAGWRQTSLGYGAVRNMPEKPADMEDAMRRHRRGVVREYEGRESNIAVIAGDDGYGLFVNGKADGSALNDAGTQVMLGMVGAVLHPGPKSAFVIGLGTGASAGWLAAVPGMERVDVAELELRVADVAREFFGPVNLDVLSQPNVHIIPGDAREVLLAAERKYDLIVSEPSNPYRAGVAGLFTREYYAAVRARLAPGGIFSQWLQGYQLTVESLQLTYATLVSEFPHVETWMTQANDLLFVCHLEEPAYPIERLRERLARPPFDEAIKRAWLENSVEGFVARHFAGPEIARRIAAVSTRINRDDCNLLEYGLARAQLGASTFRYRELLGFAVAAQQDQPAHLRGSLDVDRLAEARMFFLAAEAEGFDDPRPGGDDASGRVRAFRSWGLGEHAAVVTQWRGMATSPAQQLMLAMAGGRGATKEQAEPLIRAIERDWPVDARIAAAWVALRHGDAETAARRVGEAFEFMARQPWVRPASVKSVVDLTAAIHEARPQEAERLLAAWRTRTSVGQLSVSAPGVWYRLAFGLPVNRQIEVLQAIGPEFPWTREYLTFRWRALARAGHPLALRAAADLGRFQREEGRQLPELFGEERDTVEPARGR